MDPQSDAAPGSNTALPPVHGGVAVPTPVGVPSQPMPEPMQPAAVPLPQAVAAPADEPSDVLDEQWVQKAKDIVERTKGDPFQATQELSKMKADYLKARFNKDTKIAEDHST